MVVLNLLEGLLAYGGAARDMPPYPVSIHDHAHRSGFIQGDFK
jgi:hypothetical protein